MSRFEKTRCMAPYFIGDPPPAPMTVVDTKAMGDAIEALEKRLDTHNQAIDRLNQRADGWSGQLARQDEHVDAIEERLAARVQSIAADMSRLEQRAAPKADLAPGAEYLVRWRKFGPRTVGSWSGQAWSKEADKGGVAWWTISDAPPHWIGPRVDLPK